MKKDTTAKIVCEMNFWYNCHVIIQSGTKTEGYIVTLDYPESPNHGQRMELSADDLKEVKTD